ncbi:hypothetical protein D3C86_1572970 [compost metagenome]
MRQERDAAVISQVHVDQHQVVGQRGQQTDCFRVRGGDHDAATWGQIAKKASHAVGQGQVALNDQGTEEGTAQGGVPAGECRRRVCAAGGQVIHHEQTPPITSSATGPHTRTPSAIPPSDNRTTHIPLLCPAAYLECQLSFRGTAGTMPGSWPGGPSPRWLVERVDFIEEMQR